ncbi:ankyrin repeat domain-containing protein [Helicobacter sp. MIT 11-5569]|nr:ankyrin repeat domain-containing protein [Helicobacter sp. MIT 11-5569]
MRAAYSCEEHDNDFSILDYLFNEYGLSLKDPKYNFFHSDMKYIKEINEKYILLEKGKLEIYRETLIYQYIAKANNPNPEIVKYLVDKGARFDIYEGELENFPKTPLHFWAWDNNNYLSELEVAIKGGANVDMPTLTRNEYAFKETLLFHAIREPANYRTTQLLIELGANVNYANPNTPLDKAKGTRNKKLLKEAGAMTRAQIEKKFKIPPYYFEKGDDIEKECGKHAKLLNDAIKGAKENG